MEANPQDTTQRATDNHSSSETSDVLKWKADGFELREWRISEINTTFLLNEILKNISSNYDTFGGPEYSTNKEVEELSNDVDYSFGGLEYSTNEEDTFGGPEYSTNEEDTFGGPEYITNKEAILKDAYEHIPDNIKDAICFLKEKYKRKFNIKNKDLENACEYEKRHSYIRDVFNYVQDNYSPNEKNKETDTQVYQDIKTGLQIMIKSKTQYGAEDKKNMKNIIKSLKCHLNEFNEGEIESSQKDEERQEFMKLLSKSLTQKKENTEEEYIITNEQLIKILPLARNAHVRFYMNNDDPNSKVLNTRLIKLLHSVRNQKNYKDLVTSIIYTILNCNDIKKSDYKTVMDILLNENYQNEYKNCENKYENFLKFCKNHNFNDIQKLFCCVMLTAKDKLDSKINVSDTLDNIIQNFMIKHDWPLKEQEEKNKENGTTNKSNEEKKETSEETKQEEKKKKKKKL